MAYAHASRKSRVQESANMSQILMPMSATNVNSTNESSASTVNVSAGLSANLTIDQSNNTSGDLSASSAATPSTNKTVVSSTDVKPESKTSDEMYMSSPYMVKGLTRDFQCPQTDGHFVDPKDCTVYYHCVAGVAYRRDCMTGQVFLHEAASCVSANLAPPCIQAFSNKVQIDKEFGKLSAPDKIY
uniref:Chitin-binding type-2 domain-containing protein n=1 Tax=Biomphalaria glabrata TaxID=6526 RepID=A0A2C9LKQ8_BIOGL